MKLKLFLLAIFFSISSICSDEALSESRLSNSVGTESVNSWTESDWVAWWTNIENLYLSGLEYEGLYSLRFRGAQFRLRLVGLLLA